MKYLERFLENKGKEFSTQEQNFVRKLSNIFLLVRDSDERESSAVYTLY